MIKIDWAAQQVLHGQLCEDNNRLDVALPGIFTVRLDLGYEDQNLVIWTFLQEEEEVEGTVWEDTPPTPGTQRGTTTDTPTAGTAQSPALPPPGDPPPPHTPPPPPPTPGTSPPPDGPRDTTVTRKRKRKEILIISVIETVGGPGEGKLIEERREKFDKF